MLAFEVYINGKKKCTAGIGEPGVLTATLTWVLGDQANRGITSENLGVQLGGLFTRTNEFVHWFQRRVRRGDEITVRIVEVSDVDTPKQRRRESPAQRRRQQQAYVRRMAKQFGWKIETRATHSGT